MLQVSGSFNCSLKAVSSGILELPCKDKQFLANFQILRELFFRNLCWL